MDGRYQFPLMATSTDNLVPFAINPALDPSRLRTQYKAHRRLLVRDFLAPEGAAILHHHLSQELDWSLICGIDGEVAELTADFRRQCGPDEERGVLRQVYESAGRQFSFAYENSGFVPESSTERQSDSIVLESFTRFVNSAEFVDFARTVTGVREIASTEVQATAFRGGHFRMFGGGSIEYLGRKRLVASLSLTPQWANAWGGKLLFPGFDGHIEHTHTPSFNALSLFDVRELHAISMVAPLPGIARYAVVGWLQTAGPASDVIQG